MKSLFSRAAGEFRPARLKEQLHAAAGLPHGGVVLVENVAIMKYQVDIRSKLVPQFVPAEVILVQILIFG